MAGGSMPPAINPITRKRSGQEMQTLYCVNFTDAIRHIMEPLWEGSAFAFAVDPALELDVNEIAVEANSRQYPVDALISHSDFSAEPHRFITIDGVIYAVHKVLK
jgi:hypothetical protein